MSWGNWDRFVAYSTRLNWCLPDMLQQPVAALATAGELTFAVALISGIYTRLAAYGAASLLTCFALAMPTGLGVRSPLDYSVFVEQRGRGSRGGNLMRSSYACRGARKICCRSHEN